MRKIEQEALDALEYENETNNYQDDALNEADIDDETAGILIDRMFEVLGDDDFTEDQMWDALVQTGFDAELAVDRLLNPLKKTKSKQEDKKSRNRLKPQKRDPIRTVEQRRNQSSKIMPKSPKLQLNQSLTRRNSQRTLL